MTRLLLAIYCAVFLVSASLLFVAQPMIARLVLPLFGGSPAVWTTSMLYFQAMLLGGYAYAHWLTKLASLKTQLVVHSLVVALPLVLLPIAVPAGWSVDSGSPVASLLLLLLVASGGPFLVVTTTSPLLQRWFSQTTHKSAADPYFLYAISNFGSMVALIGYPFVAEPLLGLSDQVHWWAWGYGLLFVGVVGSAVLTWRNRQRFEPASGETQKPASPISPSASVPFASPSPTRKERWTWIVLAFLPSSWMLSTTARLTTNIAPMPLLWIIPLSLYLLTFILVFAKRQVIPHSWVVRLLPFAAILLSVSLLVSGRWQLMAIEIGVFFLATMFCHGELAHRRPAADRLTDFYLMMSIGGALGGLFNAALAPLVFSVYLEFPIVVAIVSWIRPSSERAAQRVPETASKRPTKQADEDTDADSRVDLVLLLGVTLVIGLLLRSFEIETSVAMTMIVVVAIPVLVVLHFWGYTEYSSFVLLFVLAWDQFDPGPNYVVIERARSFFGAHTVVDDAVRADVATGIPLPRYRRLMHGTTQHGCQSLDASRRAEPLAYYHPSGPLGDVFEVFGTEASTANAAANSADRTADSADQVAVIGLGTGAMAAYSNENIRFTFFEIDPVVKRLSDGDSGVGHAPFFTYLADAKQANQQIIVGDGRLKIADSDDGKYSILLLDAFSSDAIPTHLLTTEAIRLYVQKVNSTGVVVFHISNMYLDLSRVLAGNADSLGLTAYICRDIATSEKEWEDRSRLGIGTSTYVIMARKKEHLRSLTSDRYRWRPLERTSKSVIWTDDFSNILSVLEWDPEGVSLAN